MTFEPLRGYFCYSNCVFTTHLRLITVRKQPSAYNQLMILDVIHRVEISVFVLV